MFRKKIPFGRIIPPFFLRKCRIWPFLNYLHDSNSIFWAQGIKSEWVLGRHSILSVNQLSVYGAVAAICEEFESHQDRSGEPEILMGPSIVLGEVKAEAPLQNENPMNDQIIWQQYIQQVESLSPEQRWVNSVRKQDLCVLLKLDNISWPKTLENLTHFRSVACREYTLPRDDPASQAKGWIQGNMRIGPVLEVHDQFSALQVWNWNSNLVGESRQFSILGPRISYGTVKYVIDSIQDNTEIPADPQEEQLPQTSIKVVAARSKAKAKPQPRVLVGTTETIPIHERRWIDIEPSEQNLASYDLSKKVGESSSTQSNVTEGRRWSNWISQNQILSSKSSFTNTTLVWWSLESVFGCRRRFEKKISVLLWWFGKDSLYLRALQGHSGSNLIDPTLQDHVVIGTGIFLYVYHIGCAFNLHSIINSQNLSRRQTVFFLPTDPRDETHKDPEHIDFSVPRLARYVHSAWKRHQDAVFWVDIDLAIREGLTFYQTR